MNRKQFIEQTMRLTLVGGLLAASGHAIIKNKNSDGVDCDLDIQCKRCDLAEQCNLIPSKRRDYEQ